MTHALKHATTLALTLLLTSLSGCGSGGDQPELGKVEGTITLDGHPLADAIVYFSPEGGRTSFGQTDADGYYSLEYTHHAKGAKVGRHSVRVSTAVDAEVDDDGRVLKPGFPEKVPPRYNEQSELAAEVKSGKNEIDFPLTSQ